MSDALVLNCVVSHNRPFNTQLIADLLATKGVKKPAAQRSLDALAASGKVRVKEFGKTKIYYPNQDTVVLDKEELQLKRAATVELNQELATLRQRAAADKKDLAALQSAQTVEQLKASVETLQADVGKLEAQLEPLRTGQTSVSKEDNDAIEAVFADYMSAWQRRKRMFNDVWGTMADGMTRKEADVFEEVGVDTDESVKVSYRDFSHLLPKRRR